MNSAISWTDSASNRYRCENRPLAHKRIRRLDRTPRLGVPPSYQHVRDPCQYKKELDEDLRFKE